MVVAHEFLKWAQSLPIVLVGKCGISYFVPHKECVLQSSWFSGYRDVQSSITVLQSIFKVKEKKIRCHYECLSASYCSSPHGFRGHFPVAIICSIYVLFLSYAYISWYKIFCQCSLVIMECFLTIHTLCKEQYLNILSILCIFVILFHWCIIFKFL